MTRQRLRTTLLAATLLGAVPARADDIIVYIHPGPVDVAGSGSSLQPDFLKGDLYDHGKDQGQQPGKDQGQGQGDGQDQGQHGDGAYAFDLTFK